MERKKLSRESIMPWPPFSSWIRAAAVCVIAFSLYWLVRGSFSGQYHGVDFRSSYLSAQSLYLNHHSYHDPRRTRGPCEESFSFMDGGFTAFVERVRQKCLPSYDLTFQLHPVLGAWYMWPFIRMEINRAFELYNCLQAFLVCISVLVALKFSTRHHEWRMHAGVALFILITSLWPSLSIIDENLRWGQTDSIVLFFCVLAWCASLKNFSFLSGALIACAAADKVIPLALLLTFSRRTLPAAILGFMSGLCIIFLLLSLSSGSAVAYDLLLYPRIAYISNYNILQNFRMKVSAYDAVLSPGLISWQFASFFFDPNLHSKPALYFIAFAAALALLRSRLGISALLLPFLASGFTGTRHVFLASSTVLFAFGLLSLWRLSRLPVSRRLRINIASAIVCLAVFPALMKTFWAHHAIFWLWGIFLGIASLQGCRHRLGASLCLLAGACLISLKSFGFDLDAFSPVHIPGGYSVHVLRFGSLGCLVSLLGLALTLAGRRPNP